MAVNLSNKSIQNDLFKILNTNISNISISEYDNKTCISIIHDENTKNFYPYIDSKLALADLIELKRLILTL